MKAPLERLRRSTLRAALRAAGRLRRLTGRRFAPRFLVIRVALRATSLLFAFFGSKMRKLRGIEAKLSILRVFGVENAKITRN